MSAEQLAQILGWIATILFTLMLLPQIIKTIRTKSTKGVSLALFVIYLIANLIAFIYAIMINEPPLIIKYDLAILTAIFYITIYGIYYRKEKN